MNSRFVSVLTSIRERLEGAPQDEAVRMMPDEHPHGSEAGSQTLANYVKNLRKRAHKGDWRALHAMSKVAHHSGAPKKAADYAAKAKAAKAGVMSGGAAKPEPKISKEHEKARARLAAYREKHGHNPPMGHKWEESMGEVDDLDNFFAEAARLLVREAGLDEDTALDFAFDVAQLGATNGYLPPIPPVDASPEEVSTWLEAAENAGFGWQLFNALDEQG